MWNWSKCIEHTAHDFQPAKHRTTWHRFTFDCEQPAGMSPLESLGKKGGNEDDDVDRKCRNTRNRFRCSFSSSVHCLFFFWKCANEPHDFQFTILSTNYLQIHCKSVLCGLRYACSKTNTKWIDRDRVNRKWFESFVAVNDSRENYFVFGVDGEFTSIPVAPASLS